MLQYLARGQAGQTPVVEEDVPGPWFEEAADRAKYGGFSRAVRSHDAGDRSGRNLQVDSSENISSAIAGEHLLHTQ
jgi:hypothetical protein